MLEEGLRLRYLATVDCAPGFDACAKLNLITSPGTVGCAHTRFRVMCSFVAFQLPLPDAKHRGTAN